MRTRYLITYDIAHEERLRRVFKIMKGTGAWLQYSVFQCDLSDKEREELISDLTRVINHREDQVLFVDLGPCEGTGAAARISAIGRAYTQRERQATVV